MRFTSLLPFLLLAFQHESGVGLLPPSVPTVTIASLAATPGVLYWTPDGVNAVTLCVSGTTSPGCPVIAAQVVYTPSDGSAALVSYQYAYTPTSSGPVWQPLPADDSGGTASQP